MANDSQMPVDTDREVRKEVTMMAHPPEQHSASRDKWIEQITGVDINETETITNKRAEVRVDLGESVKGLNISEWDFDDDVASSLANRFDLADGRVGVDVITEEEEHQVHRESDVARELLNCLAPEIGDEIAGGLEIETRSCKTSWENPDDHNWEVYIHHPDFGMERVLSKEEKRESDDMYESMSEVPALSFMVKMIAPSETWINTWTDEVITGLHRELAKTGGIGKVRYSSCTVEQSRSGECYRL